MICDYEDAILSVQEHNNFFGVNQEQEQYNKMEFEQAEKDWNNGFSIKWKYKGAGCDLCFFEDWQSTKEKAIEKCKLYKEKGLKSDKEKDVNKIDVFVTTGSNNKVVFEI